MINYNPINPLLLGGPVKKVRSINTRDIVGEYKSNYNINVKPYFKTKVISLYKCLKTGYLFYHPRIVGKEELYKKLSSIQYYYPSWRWEYDVAINYAKPNSKILEIGFGNGAFLNFAKSKGASVDGIEINEDQVRKARKNGISAKKYNVLTYSKICGKQYDVICAFQLIEHLPTVGIAIKAMIKMLKPGGLLIISVPNNDSFLKRIPLNPFDVPPHHQGLWTPDTLKKICKYFPIRLVNIKTEPLQDYHFITYYKYEVKPALSRFILNSWINKAFEKIALSIIRISHKIIIGHTVVCVYEKGY